MIQEFETNFQVEILEKIAAIPSLKQITNHLPSIAQLIQIDRDSVHKIHNEIANKIFDKYLKL